MIRFLAQFLAAQVSPPPEADVDATGDSQAGSNGDEVPAGPDNEKSLGDKTEEIAGQVAGWFGETFQNTTLTGWLILAGGIFGGLLAGKIAQAILRRIAAKLEKRGWDARGAIFNSLASPLSLALFSIGLRIGLEGVYLVDEVGTFAHNITQFLIIFAIGWFCYNLVELVDVAMRRLTAKTQSALDDQLAPLVRKTLRVFLVVVFALFVAENVFGADITAWLAGLGVAGLALSLAAQDSVKNLFGSLTVLIDQPFKVGDRIEFDGDDGIIEEIGFRSTRLRTLTGHLVTIPNMKFIDGVVENIAARPSIRRVMNVTITYDTPPEKVQKAVQILRDLLDEPECREAFDMEKTPPRVYFEDFGSTSLNIIVYYWYMLDPDAGKDWWGYLAHGEAFNMKLLKAYNDAGIEFAFPTQTLYLAGDPTRELLVRTAAAEAS